LNAKEERTKSFNKKKNEFPYGPTSKHDKDYMHSLPHVIHADPGTP